LGLGGSELDVKSLRYGRVIIMTDADDGILPSPLAVSALSQNCFSLFYPISCLFIVFATAQGAHIRVLLLTFFLSLSARAALEQGHVYIAQPLVKVATAVW
jgi:DNA gyrase/topoisomerase IV subunit B